MMSLLSERPSCRSHHHFGRPTFWNFLISVKTAKIKYSEWHWCCSSNSTPRSLDETCSVLESSSLEIGLMTTCLAEKSCHCGIGFGDQAICLGIPFWSVVVVIHQGEAVIWALSSSAPFHHLPYILLSWCCFHWWFDIDVVDVGGPASYCCWLQRACFGQCGSGWFVVAIALWNSERFVGWFCTCFSPGHIPASISFRGSNQHPNPDPVHRRQLRQDQGHLPNGYPVPKVHCSA